MKHPDAVYNSDKLDKSESAFYSALLGKNKTKQKYTQKPQNNEKTHQQQNKQKQTNKKTKKTNKPKTNQKNPTYQNSFPKVENSFPAAHTTVVFASMEEGRAMFKYIIPYAISRLQSPGPSLCGAFSSVCVCVQAYGHKWTFPGPGVAFIIKTPKGDK